MQPPKNAFFRVRLVVLHESFGDSRLGKDFFVKNFQKISSVIRVHFWLNQQYALKLRGEKVHENLTSSALSIFGRVFRVCRSSSFVQRQAYNKCKLPVAALSGFF